MGTFAARRSHRKFSNHFPTIFSLFRVKIVIKIAIKMVGSLIVVLLVAAVGTQAAKLTSTGVDLEPIFDFLDDDGSNTVSTDELKALTTTGDADGNAEDGKIVEAENVALFGRFDKDGSGGIDLDE